MRKIATPFLLLSLCAAAGCAGNTGDEVSKVNAATSPLAAEATDIMIASQVKGKLVAIDVDTAVNIAVSSTEGDVDLHGVVRRKDEIPRLVAAARSVKGVKSVEEQISVNPKLERTSEKLGDVSLATAVEANLAAQTGVNALHVSVHVLRGVVTLQGSVPSIEIATVMRQAAEKTHGVKKVVDELAVSP